MVVVVVAVGVAVARATCSKSSLPLRELQGNRLFSFLLGNFDACDFVLQASELENSLLARD